MKSYSTSWATPARSSRVQAPRRNFNTISRVSDLGGPPAALLVTVGGDHTALDYGGRYELRDAQGAVGAKGTKPAHQPLVVWGSTLLGGNNEVDFAGRGWSASWADARRISAASNDADKTWALSLGDTDGIFVLQRASVGVNRHVATPEGGIEVADRSALTLEVAAGRFIGEHPRSLSIHRVAELEGAGCGAIADDGRVAVAMADKRFVLFDANRLEIDGVMKPVATSRLDFVPVDISVVEGGVAVLSTSSAGSVVHMLDAAGKQAWEATVPFVADAPPIDAGGGRVAVAGAGFAAVEGGKTLWAQTSKSRVFATALADGSALVAVGPELRVTNRDGAILQALRVPEGDAIVAPPAVAADGTAWVATAKALYVVR